MSSGGPAFFENENPDGGWYRANLGAGGFKSLPADTSYGTENPLMWSYGHTYVGNNDVGGPSFHAGSRLLQDHISIRTSSLSHPLHVRRHVDSSPLLATTEQNLSSELVFNRWPLLQARLATDYPPQM